MNVAAVEKTEETAACALRSNACDEYWSDLARIKSLASIGVARTFEMADSKADQEITDVWELLRTIHRDLNSLCDRLEKTGSEYRLGEQKPATT